jgi:hypothetical protein
VSPVLTPGEATRHPLFNAEVLQAIMDDMAAKKQAQEAGLGMQGAHAQVGGMHAGSSGQSGAVTTPGTSGAPGTNKPFTYGPWG